MRSHFISRAMNWLTTVALLALIGVLSWGVAHEILGLRVTGVIIVISVLAMIYRVLGARGLVRRQMGGRRIEANELEELHDLVARLSRAAGLRRKPELWYTPDSRPNAHAFGTRSRSGIAVSDGLLRLMEPREIAGVVAHEVAHIAHGDLWIMQGALAMSRALHRMMRLGKILLVLVVPFVLLGVAPVPWEFILAIFGYQAVMTALVRTVSRIREFEADRGGAAITGDPGALLSALKRMTEISPPRLRDRLWPFTLFNSHPSLADRETRLLRMKTSRGVVPDAVVQQAPAPKSKPVRARVKRSAEPGQSVRRSPQDPTLGDCPF